MKPSCKRLLWLPLIFLALFAPAGCARATAALDAAIPVNYVLGSYSLDVQNLAALVGDADYVCIGRIESLTGTAYKGPGLTGTGTEAKDLSFPYTRYTVRVLENIKGQLRQDQAIPVQKAGGIAKSGKTCYLYENDSLPLVDRCYIFNLYVQQDGTLLAAGLNSTILLDAGLTDLADHAQVKAIRKAYQDQIVTDRVRSLAKPEILAP